MPLHSNSACIKTTPVASYNATNRIAVIRLLSGINITIVANINSIFLPLKICSSSIGSSGKSYWNSGTNIIC
ncbi:MAG: hypothetical protein IPI98_00560 [Chitinophagaceae bacterium]|nr:hypothetical protein [Chitinophagaceae bacterium]